MSHSPVADELRDAVTPRAVLLMVGVLVVQLGFLLSYVGAFHHPDAHGVPLAVAGPSRVARQLDRLPGDPVVSTVVADRTAARERILRRDAQGAYVVDAGGTRDTLLVASAAGSSVTAAVREVGERFAQAQGRRLDVVDVVPVADGDRGSLTAFYLVVGWLVGGYLAASMLGAEPVPGGGEQGDGADDQAADRVRDVSELARAGDSGAAATGTPGAGGVRRRRAGPARAVARRAVRRGERA